MGSHWPRNLRNSCGSQHSQLFFAVHSYRDHYGLLRCRSTLTGPCNRVQMKLREGQRLLLVGIVACAAFIVLAFLFGQPPSPEIALLSGDSSMQRPAVEASIESPAFPRS